MDGIMFRPDFVNIGELTKKLKYTDADYVQTPWWSDAPIFFLKIGDHAKIIKTCFSWVFIHYLIAPQKYKYTCEERIQSL